MNKAQALEVVLQEYSFLQNHNTKITKQFVASDGRISNVFLIESDKEGFFKFIAKAINDAIRDNHPHALIKEYSILIRLQEKQVPAPRLLTDQKPGNFLLMSFIDGPTAPEAINKGQDKNGVFRKIGETTGEIHTVEVPNFGDILSPEGLSWKDLQMRKLKRLTGNIKEILGESLLVKIQEVISSTKYILDDDSKGKPVLINHDIYLDNFIIDKRTKKAVLIDYGIAFGGRPFFDLAKLYIWTLHEYPDQRDNFLQGYRQFVDIPANFSDMMKFYVIRECFGMINFFQRTSKEATDHAISVLQNVVDRKGTIIKLLERQSLY